MQQGSKPAADLNGNRHTVFTVWMQSMIQVNTSAEETYHVFCIV